MMLGFSSMVPPKKKKKMFQPNPSGKLHILSHDETHMPNDTFTKKRKKKKQDQAEEI